jgi:thioredoxin reductase (NADPH)
MVNKNVIQTKVLIIGSGPAGCTAAIYAARSNLKPVMVRGMQPGGQLTITTDVENYPGFADPVQGPWLMEQMEKQAANVGTEIISDHVNKVDFSTRPYKCYGDSGNVYISDVVIIATGAQAKWLGIESEMKYQGFGVSGCATCDGFFFKNKKVAVVGGGNTAVEEALYLSNIASEVILIHRRDSLRAEKIMQDKLFKNPKIKILWNNQVDEILGQDEPFKSVNSIRLKDNDGNLETLDIDGVFIAIGHKPNTDIFKNQIDMDNSGYLLTRPDSTATSLPGIFACGDVQDKIYRQAITAAGTGCMAAIEADGFINS